MVYTTYLKYIDTGYISDIQYSDVESLVEGKQTDKYMKNKL